MSGRRGATVLILIAVAAAGTPGLSITPSDAASSDSPAIYQPHPSIHIEGDDDFDSPRSGVRSGSGTPDDPYRIARWRIVTTSDHGIRLVNTSAHVVIEGIVMTGLEGAATRALNPECIPPSTPGICGTKGIDLEHARNVTIQDVRIDQAGIGLRVNSSSHARADSVDIGAHQRVPETTAVGTGLQVRWSHDVAVSNVSANADSPLNFIAVQRFIARNATFVGDLGPSPVLPWTDAPSSLLWNTRNVTFDRTHFQDMSLWLLVRTEGFSFLRSSMDGGGLDWQGFFDAGGHIDDLRVCGSHFTGFAHPSRPAMDIATEGNVTVRNSTFEDNGKGASLTANRVAFEGNRVLNSTGEGLGVRPVDGEIHNNSFVGNGDGVGISTPPEADGPTDARWNWWGDASGPSGEGDGTGDPISTLGEVIYRPWLEEAPEHGMDCGPV